MMMSSANHAAGSPAAPSAAAMTDRFWRTRKGRKPSGRRRTRRTSSGTPTASRREPLAAMTPGKLLTTPGLWAGLLFAALFLFAAVRVRRHREPI